MEHISDSFKGSLKDVGSIIPISVQSKEKSKRIRDQVKDLQTKNTSLQTEHNKYLNKINEESSVAELLKQEASILKRYIEDKDSEINALNKSIREQSENISNLNNEKDQKDKEISKLQKDYSEKVENEKNLNSDINTLNQLLEKERKEVSQLQLTLQETETRLYQDLKDTSDRLHNEINETTNIYQTKLNERTESLQLEIKLNQDRYQNEIKDKQDEIQRLLDSIKEKEDEIKQLKMEMDQVQVIQLKLSNEINEFQIQINSLTQQNQNQSLEIKELTDALSKTRESVQKLEVDFRELNVKFDQSETNLNEITEKYNQSQLSLQSEQSNLSQLQSEAKKLENDINDQKSTINQLNQELSIKSSQNDELFQIRSTLNLEIECVRKSHLKEMEDLTNQLSLLQEKSQLDQAELTNKHAEIEQLNLEIQTLQSKIEQLDQVNIENQSLQSQIQSQEEKLAESNTQLLKLNRSIEVLEFERNSLKSENESIKSIVSQHSDPQLEEKVNDIENLRKENQTYQLSIMEKNNEIQDKDALLASLKEQIAKLEQDNTDLEQQVQLERTSKSEEIDNFNKKLVEQTTEYQLRIDTIESELQEKIKFLEDEKDLIQKEANNLAQKLSIEIDKSHNFEVQIKHYQRELESSQNSRDNLVQEIQELQELKLLDGANKEIESKTQKDFNDFKAKSTEEFEKIHQERVQWDSIKKDLSTQLTEEKAKYKALNDQTVDFKRILGVIEKIVSKLLEENESQKFESMSPESFYAMIDAVKKELTQTLSHRKQYYDDEDLMGQLIMEREARRLAESQVMIVLEKSKIEINKYKEIIQNTHNNSNNSNKTSFFSNILKSLNEPQPQNQNNNFLKRTFTGTNYQKK